MLRSYPFPPIVLPCRPPRRARWRPMWTLPPITPISVTSDDDGGRTGAPIRAGGAT